MNIRTEFEEQLRMAKRIAKEESWTGWDFDTYLTNLSHLDFVTRDDTPENLTKDEKQLLYWRDLRGTNRFNSLVKDLRNKIKQYETSMCPCYLDKLTKEEKQTISDINDIISGRVRYGKRDLDIDPKKDAVIQWSNGFEGWLPNRLNYGKTSLDANEVLIKNKNLDEIVPLLCCLNDLPLYTYSYEATEKLSPEEREKIKKDWASIMDASLKQIGIDKNMKKIFDEK